MCDVSFHSSLETHRLWIWTIGKVAYIDTTHIRHWRKRVCIDDFDDKLMRTRVMGILYIQL
jgi:hypothetical protein